MWLFTSKNTHTHTHTHTKLLKWIREEHVESSSTIPKVEVCWEKYKISKMELFAKIVKGFQLSSKHILIMLMRRFVCPNSNCPNSSSERSSTLFHYLRCRFGTSFQMATSWNFVYCKAKEELLWVFSKVTVLFLWDNHGG